MLRIRLRRMGSRNRPFYRIVVSDSRRVPGAPALEELGYYDPLKKPKVVSLKSDRIEYWEKRGAVASETVAKLVRDDLRMRSKAAAAESGAAAETSGGAG